MCSLFKCLIRDSANLSQFNHSLKNIIWRYQGYHMDSLTKKIVLEAMFGETNGSMAAIPNSPIIFGIYSTYHMERGLNDWEGGKIQFLKDIVSEGEYKSNAHHYRVKFKKNHSIREIDGLLSDGDKALIDEMYALKEKYEEAERKAADIIRGCVEKLPQYDSCDFFNERLRIVPTYKNSFIIEGKISRSFYVDNE